MLSQAELRLVMQILIPGVCGKGRCIWLLLIAWHRNEKLQVVVYGSMLGVSNNYVCVCARARVCVDIEALPRH